jgi:hypothetical protein
MNMKLKVIAAACMAMCASSAFAVVANVACVTTDTQVTNAVTGLTSTVPGAVMMVNTCAPEAKMFIAGSSALGSTLSAVVSADLFDTTTQPIITVKDTSTSAQAANTTGWYGMSKAGLTNGVSKRLYVVYNKNNGSAAGVSIMLAKPATIPEATVVTVGPVSAKVANTCVASATANTVNCAASDVVTAGDLAISDVHPNELYKLYATATAKVSTLTTTPLALQGMGLGVSFELYKALQVRNIAEGLYPASLATPCTGGDLRAVCQPSVRSADYASLITKAGAIKSAATFLGDAADTTPLTLARRDDLSGTQASSNIFFANNSCGGMGYGIGGNNYGVLPAATATDKNGFNYNPATNKLDKLAAAVMGGGLNIIGSATAGVTDTTQYPGVLNIMSAIGGGDVTNALNVTVNKSAVLATAADVAAGTISSVTGLAVVAVGEVITPATTGGVPNYAIGVISLTSAPASSVDTWKFVKIDGVSPNYKADGTVSYKMREQFANGNYPFAMTAYAATPVKPAATSIGKLYPQVVQAVISGLKDSGLHDLAGIAYLDGAADVAGTPKQAKVHRTAGNNCSPLIK